MKSRPRDHAKVKALKQTMAATRTTEYLLAKIEADLADDTIDFTDVGQLVGLPNGTFDDIIDRAEAAYDKSSNTKLGQVLWKVLKKWNGWKLRKHPHKPKPQYRLHTIDDGWNPEIVVVQFTYPDGCDVVAAFDGERERLRALSEIEGPTDEVIRQYEAFAAANDELIKQQRDSKLGDWNPAIRFAE
jgi:hypothetical protein